MGRSLLYSTFFPLTGLIQPLLFSGFEAQSSSIQIVLKLLKATRADDRAGNDRIAQLPGEGDL